jgi:hypothetical protein
MDARQNIELILSQVNHDEDKDLRKKLSATVNELILHDFPSLVQLLYRVDVDEVALKRMLSEHENKDAGDIIADLLIERQLQKNKLSGNSDPDNIPDTEKW